MELFVLLISIQQSAAAQVRNAPNLDFVLMLYI